MTAPAHATIDRRATLKWLTAAMTASLTASVSACGRPDRGVVGRDERDLFDDWATNFLGEPKRITGAGYGTDPDMLNPTVPWERTMTPGQLALAASLSDVILPEDDVSPAASTLGVQDFVDEWVSAPYEDQYNDRGLLFTGFGWLERRAREQFGRSFAAAGLANQDALVSRIAGPPIDGFADSKRFFTRFRHIAMGAYYTTDEGMADLQYIGNTPIMGDYPGPTPEALAHLRTALRSLGLRADF